MFISVNLLMLLSQLPRALVDVLFINFVLPSPLLIELHTALKRMKLEEINCVRQGVVVFQAFSKRETCRPVCLCV